MAVLGSSMMTWLIGASLVALVLLSTFRKSGITRNGRALRKPPNTLPLVGNGLLFLQAREKLFAWFVKCERIFGHETFELYVPSLPPGVVINDPRNLDYVFKNEAIFAKGEFMKKPLWDLFGHGIINSDGELWRVQRKAGLSFLTTKNLQVLTDVAMPQYLAQSINHLKAISETGREADLQAVFHEITSQVMGKMAYNMEMHADDAFTIAFDYASGATAERVQNPLWQITELLFGARMRKSIVIVKDFGLRIVNTAIEDRSKEVATGDAASAKSGKEYNNSKDNEKLNEISGSLIQSLLDSIGDKQMVADAALNYLSAGRDTTAQSLTWTFHLLLQHRYAYAKIRNEVHQVLLSSSSTTLNPSLLNPTALPYTHAVFLESLRLYPPIPFEIKQVQPVTGATLPDGTHLPRNTIVVWSPWAMNRARSTWPPPSANSNNTTKPNDDTESFRPERWLTTTGTTTTVITKSAAEFPVFNGGPRLCLGKTMAMLIAVQTIAAVVWTFDFVPAYEGRERRSKSSLTLPMDGGLPVVVKVRSRAVGAGREEDDC